MNKVPCFGKIGEWTDEFKNFVINHFPKKLNYNCANCIINSLEKIVEPDIKKIMHYIQNDYYMTNLALQNCKHKFYISLISLNRVPCSFDNKHV